MQEIFAQLGGLYEVEENRDVKLSANDIQNIETTIGNKLPKDYVQYLLEYGLKGTNEMVFYSPKQEHPIYQHSEDLDLPNPVFSGSYLSVLFGKNEQEEYDILYELEEYQDRIPTSCIPIGTDGGGNLILMDLKENNYGFIYFWDHEYEWDAEEYEEETGLDFTEEIKYQNTYLIADSFSSFLEKLTVKEEE